MSRLAAACLMMASMAAPAWAQEAETPNPLDVLLDAFESPEGLEYAARFLREPSGAGSLIDPVGDFQHSSGETPGFTPRHIDIVGTWALELDPGPLGLFEPTDSGPLWAPTGSREVDPPSYEPFHSFTGDRVHDGSQYEGGALLFGFTLADTPPPTPQGRCEYVVWVNDAVREQTFVRNPSFPLDPAGDTNVAFGLGLNPEGSPTQPSAFALELAEGGGFSPASGADIRAVVTPRYVGITVPRELIGEISALNFYAFCVEEGSGLEPAGSGSDQTGLVEIASEELGSVRLVAVDVPISTTTTVPSTTTTSSAVTTTTLPVIEDIEDEPGTGFPWWLVLIAGGLGLALGGWWVYTGQDDPCQELHRALREAEERCREARDRAAEAADQCEIAELELAGLEDERKEICKTWPPVCWDTPEGDWIEDERGHRITSRDIHMRRVALGDVWADYRAGRISASEVEARWREIDTPEFREELRATDEAFSELLGSIDTDIANAERQLDESCIRAEQASKAAEEACETAEQARLEYERCVHRADAEMSDSDISLIDTSAEAPADHADPCTSGKGMREARRVGDPEKTLVFVDFSVVAGIPEGSERGPDAGTRLPMALDDLATEMRFAGHLLEARSAGLHIGGVINGYATGSYTVTGAGILRDGIDRVTMATGDLQAEPPTSPMDSGMDGLEALGSLGDVIASKITDWVGTAEALTVGLTMFYQDITATPFEIWECTPEREWACIEQVWEIEVSGLKRLLGQERLFTVDSELRRREFGRVVRGLSHRAATTIRRDAESLARWRTEHEPEPCK